MRISAPSPPGQVAVTTFLPFCRSRTHRGSAVGSAEGPSGWTSYPPIAAAKPLIELVIGPATGWKVLAATSLWAAVDPVAMAICDTAVSDGVAGNVLAGK